MIAIATKRTEDKKTEQKVSFSCFLAVSLKRMTDDSEEIRKKADELRLYIEEKYPEFDVLFYDDKELKSEARFASFVGKYPFFQEKEMDWDCVKKTIMFLSEMQCFTYHEDKLDGKIGGQLKRVFFNCLYVFITKGWLGKGGEKLEQAVFMERMKEMGYTTYARNQFSSINTNLTRKVKGTDGVNRLDFDSEVYKKPKDIEDIRELLDFQDLFINKYWEIYLREHN